MYTTTERPTSARLRAFSRVPPPAGWYRAPVRRLLGSVLALAALVLGAPLAAGEGEGTARGVSRSGTARFSAEERKRLVELNGPELFGGKVTVTGDEFEVLYNADGQIAAGFEGPGIMDSKHELMKGVNRRFIQYGDQKDGEKLLPGLCAIAMGKGYWTTRYPVKGNTWVSFDIRIPNVLTLVSSIRVRINSHRGRGYETQFFNSIAQVAGNRPGKKVVTARKEYQRVASTWFPRHGEPVPVEFGIRGGNCTVLFSGKEMVSTPVKTDKGGRVAFIYDKITFTLQNLKIRGTIDQEWVAKELARLEQEGKLKTG